MAVLRVPQELWISAPHTAKQNVELRPNNLYGASLIIVCSLYCPFRTLLVCTYFKLHIGLKYSVPSGRVSKISNPLFHPASVFILLTARLPFVQLSKSFIKTPSGQRLNSTAEGRYLSPVRVGKGKINA
ncbi:hypothetical protein Barb6XT_02719 [Bacteroidales bacterium Barb6XT]|nr:hypothetical protein Barb6XT_02719 [Bacteroidales bacterium Barb6XT]